jgi:phage gp46-like protein
MVMSVDRQRLFGTDIGLGERSGGLDLTLEGAAGTSGDLELFAGNTNAVQALSLRLRVRKGELAPLGWPDYGSRLHELIGEPDLPRTRLKAQAFARDAVADDPRVEAVESVEVMSIPGERHVLRLALSVRLIDEPRPLDLVFNLALEGS